MNLDIRTDDTDVYINGNLHTFDGTKMSKEARILWAIADELGFEPSCIFEPDDEDFVFDKWFDT